MKEAYLSVILMLLMVCSVSAFSFQNVLAGSLVDMVTGRASIMNHYPKTTLNVPTNSQVVAGTKVKVAWSFFDEDYDTQEAYLIQFSYEDLSFDIPINLGKIGSGTSDVVDVRRGGEYYVRVKTKDSYGWGEWSETRRIFVDAEAKSCSDGTKFWQCSENSPLYCDGGVLVDNCNKCGCNANQKCIVTSGVCVKETCLDGTEYGDCSAERPYYCMAGRLRRVCSICGCPDELVCQGSGDCSVAAPVVIKEEVSTKSILERIAVFFKGIFGRVFK